MIRPPRPTSLIAASWLLIAPAAATAQAPAAPKAAPAPAPATETGDPAWDELKLRAREDVDYLETFLRARQAECSEAELRVSIYTGWKAELDRQKQKGVIAAFQWRQGELVVAENQTQLEVRRAEAKDVEIRLARARRRLRAIERSPSEAANYPATDLDDRLRERELRLERLRDELDRTRRLSESLNRLEIQKAAQAVGR